MVMRGMLVDYARRSAAAKLVQPVQTMLSAAMRWHSDVLAVHEALDGLQAINSQSAALVELKYFGGLDTAENGAAPGISEATAKRRWNAASAWLRTHMSHG